jgi:H+/Cl- antiporter ClcA
MGFAADSPWWIVVILTLSGAAVGLVLWLAPGSGGHDPATVELVAPVLPLKHLPGVAAALILGLAGGVSLGPESPIIAIAVAVAVWLMAKMAPALPAELALLMAAAAMLGAMFGSPVAAALLLTEMVAAAKRGGLLWDRLFAPVVAAATAAFTMSIVGVEFVAVDVSAYESGNALDLISGTAVALAAALLGVSAAWSMPHMHGLLRKLRHPLAYVTIGGLILGLLGALGGPLTLFKGSSQSVELLTTGGGMSGGELAWLAVIKAAALVVAAAAGFRGGRIFPAVFIGVALGLSAAAMFPAIPGAVAVGAAVLGVVLAIGRDGWLALFLAVAVVGDISILALLCVVVLPTWLLVTASPEMIVHPRKPAEAPPA